ncbi:MAG TPA: MotA/TolQ/ExbB proton channel family protein [Rectinema sp.]|jgi:biopolymer transport protein ExbB|nr:MAG: Biopolymer transport protein ExbB [Spirochaetes bacterium ADurb.Bin001]HNP93021.1 MotA/TolQ/ExbB proton channel family protein [Rectinema sp.]HNT59456.1 MotA/TolQ/ExbB proton channel family protein [Rectinema sp.]HNV35436.1 MotA/TolQ/ExbB proton channel family protein [Rectinema sp.]HNZ92984.1 MotA/TolQ/ExbB proton channel family protein [Rectinema sp.]
MLDFISKGGPILWVIMGLSLVALAIVIERLLYLKRISIDEEKLFLRIKTSLMEGHFSEALAICDQNISPFSKLLKVGIENREKPEYLQRELLKDAASLESVSLERGLTTLGTISNISTLLGLLGTVTGTMRAFGVLGKFGAVSDPAALASGVAEALITTVGGLVVAIPVIMIYNYFVSRINLIMTRLETQVNNLVSFISSYGGKEPERAEEKPSKEA